MGKYIGLPPGAKVIDDDGEDIVGLPEGASISPEASPQAPEPTPSMLQRFSAGFTGRDVAGPEGFDVGDIAQFAGEQVLPGIGAGVGALGGAALGTMSLGPLGTVTGAQQGSVLGAGAGRAAQNAIQAGLSGKDVGFLGAFMGPAVEAGGQFVGERYLGPALKKSVEVAASGARPVLSWLSGVGKDSLEMAFKRPLQVLAKRGEGAVEEAVDLARTSLQSVMGQASRAYDNVMAKLLDNSKYVIDDGWRFPLKDEIGGVVADVQKRYGFGSPERFGAEAGQADQYIKMMGILRELESATMEQVIMFQRDLNQMYANNLGKPLGAAAKEVRNALRDSLADAVPEIAQMNRLYAVMRPLEKFADRIAKKENMAGFLRTLAKNKSLRSNKELAKLKGVFPEVAEALDGVLESVAGEAITPFVREIPGTGFLASVGQLGAYGATAAVPFMSPRLAGRVTAEAGRFVQSGALPPGAAFMGGRVAGATTNFLQQAFQNRRRNTSP